LFSRCSGQFVSSAAERHARCPLLGMNVAIPTLEARVSPVFDVAQTVVLVELDADRELRRRVIPLHSPDLARRVAALSENGVDVLICGAISWPLEAMVAAAGIRVVSQTCGAVEEVLRAFVGGRLNDRAFLMPGCCGRRRQRRYGSGGRRNSRRGPRGTLRGRGRGRDGDGTGRSIGWA
jgi:predicted Fe-Mo cluster-binding NifX family protein